MTRIRSFARTIVVCVVMSPGVIQAAVTPVTHPFLVAKSVAGVDAMFSDATSSPLGNTGPGTGVAWGDYDNDGDQDLYLANFGAANKLFRNDGGTWTDATSGPLGDAGNGDGVAWGDYDNDGEFGLASATQVDSIVVRWPSGIVWDTTAVAVDQHIEIVEHENPAGVGDPWITSLQLVLSSGAPNPFVSGIRFDYALAADGYVDLSVHDLQGRRVTTLTSGHRAIGRYSAMWDRQIPDGHRAATGVYFVRLATSGRVGIFVRSRRVVAIE